MYADPPYCFVHYSRFYHILETLVRYDYPKIRYKGRYRDDRYQSEYCVKTQVSEAFIQMFEGIKSTNSDMILSYTNSSTNTIDFAELIRVCCDTFNVGRVSEKMHEMCLKRSNAFFEDGATEKVRILGQDDSQNPLDYEIAMIKKPYNHSRMGRTKTKTIPVTEVVIIAKRI